MNRQQRKIYSEKHIRRIKRFEASHVRPMYEVIRKPMLQVAEILKDEGLEKAIAAAQRIIIVEGVGSRVQDIYKQVGLWAAGRALREINVSAREQKSATIVYDVPGQKAGFGFNEQWTEIILNYFRQFLLSKAVLPISETTRRDILEILNKGTTEGWSIDRMAFELERVDMPLARARTIVRTEIAKAQFFGAELGQETSEFESTERWISAHDHRTRHSHRDIDGKVIENGELFKVPIYKGDVITGYDNMRGPGDPDASAGNIINCRCTKVVRAKRDENGRPVRKKPGQNEITAISRAIARM